MDEMHGEGKFFTKQPATSTTPGEPLVRLGRWEHGQRVAWLSRPSTQLATSTFIEYFAIVQNVCGEVEMDLIASKFHTPYAVMIASQLPNLPEGVDRDDPFVQSIVRMLAKTQNVIIGADVLEKSVAAYVSAQQALEAARKQWECVRSDVDQLEMDLRAQSRRVKEVEDELERERRRRKRCKSRSSHFGDRIRQRLEAKYKAAVDGLHACEVMDWYKLRTSSLDNVNMSLLEAFAVLLNFTTNYYLEGKPYRPTKEDIMRLLSSNEENVHLGDKEGLIHRYDVKALYVLPLFDVYSFSEGTRLEMLLSITPVIHHPRLRPNNYRLHQISPAFAAICNWVRAAFFFAKKAIDISPVVRRVMAQLVVLDHLRESLGASREELRRIQERVDEGRALLDEHARQVSDCEHREKELRRVIDDIEAFDRAEHERMEKSKIKKPQTFRPPSAGLPPKAADEGGLDDDDDDEEQQAKTDSEAKKQKAEEDVRLEAVNRRQVFEEDHSDASQLVRRRKEDVLSTILEDPDLAQDFDLLKKEVRKVIDKSGGKVPLDEFPQKFEEIMHKPLEPSHFGGIKKLRKLLMLLEDVCVIVEPEREGEVETVQFPVEPDDVPMLPRLANFCRVCPGISYATAGELSYHEKTKWHYWNMMAKYEGRAPMKYTLSATFWSEVYDSTDNSICYYNKMTGELVKGSEPPPEMQANDLVLELLQEQPREPVAPEPQAEEPGVSTVDGLEPSETVAHTEEDPWLSSR
ncbi:hypothetical protein PINS_up015679 [Pythium insidiosum]|nr:hypothetical protein PINS_up015679 [Pythium insidiosum]